MAFKKSSLHNFVTRSAKHVTIMTTVFMRLVEWNIQASSKWYHCCIWVNIKLSWGHASVVKYWVIQKLCKHTVIRAINMSAWFAVFSDHSFAVPSYFRSQSFVRSYGGSFVLSFVRYLLLLFFVTLLERHRTPCLPCPFVRQKSWWKEFKTSRLPSPDKAGSKLFTWSCRKFPRQSHFLSSYRQQHWRFKTSLSQHLSWKEVYRAMFLPSIGHLGHEGLVREKNPEAND